MRGERRDITFYAAARLDGLVRREEVFGAKLTEHFVGREDRLVYRSATFGGGAAGEGAAEVAAGGGGATGSDEQPALFGTAVVGSQPLQSAAGYGLQSQAPQQQQARALPVIKVTQKFARNAAKPADIDVAKQVFHLAQGKIIVQFHHADDKLTAGYLSFHRDGAAQAVQVSHSMPSMCIQLPSATTCAAALHMVVWGALPHLPGHRACLLQALTSPALTQP